MGLGFTPCWAQVPTCAGQRLKIPSCHQAVLVSESWGASAGGGAGDGVKVAASPVAAVALRAGVVATG